MTNKIISVSSLSGGKSSSMMACCYPTDHYVFAVVLTKDPEARVKDAGLLRECQNRIPWLEGSRELDLTLKAMLDLEQLIQAPIKWVASPYCLEDFVNGSTDIPGYRTNSVRLPNATSRFCTEQTKLIPLFQYCYSLIFNGNPILMHIGFRADEGKRVEGWTCDNDSFKFAKSCDIANKRQSWEKVNEWRISRFPLHENGITKQHVSKFWSTKHIKFPTVSNCDFCFHHKPVQQQIQFQQYPERSKWWIQAETETGQTFGKTHLEHVLAQKMFDGVFAEEPSCFCTD